MAHALCTLDKATLIHLEYVTLIDFPTAKILVRKRSSILRDIKFVVLFIDVSGLILYELYVKKYKV
jgi:hypothetical protein